MSSNAYVFLRLVFSTKNLIPIADHLHAIWPGFWHHYSVIAQCASIKDMMRAQQFFFLMKTSSRCLSSSSSQDVLKTFWRRLNQDEYVHLSLTSSEDVFKRSSRCLDQDQYICLGHMYSRHLQDVLKMSCKNVLKTSLRHLQDVLKKFWKTSSRYLQKVLQRYL